MSTFRDADGREWTIKFDGLKLKELRETHGINLADVTGADYLRIETDASLLVAAVCFLCGSRDLSQQLYGEALERALEAVWGAAKVFFPAKRLSALVSRLTTLRQLTEQSTALAILPAELQPAVIEALLGNTDLLSSAMRSSASGPDASPSPPATDSLAFAESDPKA